MQPSRIPRVVQLDSPLCKPDGSLESRTLSQDKFDQTALTAYIFEASHHFKIPPALLMSILSLETTNLNPLSENRKEQKREKPRLLASVQGKKKSTQQVVADGSRYLWGKGLAMFGAFNLSTEVDEVLLDWNAEKPEFAAQVWSAAYNVGSRVIGDSHLRFPIWSPRGSVLAMANYLSFFQKKMGSEELQLFKSLFPRPGDWVEKARYFGAMYNQGPDNVMEALTDFFKTKGFVPVTYGQALEQRKGKMARFSGAKNYVYQIAGLCGGETQGLMKDYQSRMVINATLWNQKPAPLPLNPPPRK